MAKKAESTFRVLDKVNGKIKTKVGKYYQINETHSIKAEKVLKIETNRIITEHDSIDSLPSELKAKQVVKDKK